MMLSGGSAILTSNAGGRYSFSLVHYACRETGIYQVSEEKINQHPAELANRSQNFKAITLWLRHHTEQACHPIQP